MDDNVSAQVCIVRNVEDLPLVLTPRDLQLLLGLSKNTIYSLLKSKNFPAFKVGKQYRVSQEAFANWMKKQTECVA